MNIGSGLDEFFDNFGVTFGGSPHQSRLSAAGFLGVNIGAAGEQRFDDFDRAGARGGH